MTRNRKFGVGALILVGAIAYLVYAGVQQGSVYYFKVEEFWGQKEAMAEQDVRVAGRVAEGSVSKRMTPRGTELHFLLGEFPGEEPGAKKDGLPVHFVGVVPDMFAEGRDVIVEGIYAGGRLEAHTVMTSCPSKYEAETEGPQNGKPATS